MKKTDLSNAIDLQACPRMTETSLDEPVVTRRKSVLWNPLVLSILITETAERIAYFGFRAVLVLYFTQGLQFSESTAVALCSGTAGLAYFSPLIGAVLADSSWGRFQTIWRFGRMYAFGLCLLSWAAYGLPMNSSAEGEDGSGHTDDETQSEGLGLERLLTFGGLFCVCMGTGGIKPCVSAFGADQVDVDSNSASETPTTVDKFQDEPAEDMTSKHSAAQSSSGDAKAREERIREFFNSFYFCINVGALGAFALIPIVRATYGFGAAFLIPTVSMVLALSVFRSQKNKYRHRTRDASEPTLFQIFQVSLGILRLRLFETTLCRKLASFFGITRRSSVGHAAIPLDEDSDVDTNNDPSAATRDQVYMDASKSLHLLPLMAFFPIFWMLYDQQGSVWTLQATRLNLHGVFTPEQLQFLNPLEIMIFIPLFDQKIYPWLEQHGFNIQPLHRMEYGMFLTAVSFFISAILEYQIQKQPAMSVSVLWQFPQITLLTIGEILLNVTGLEFAYSQAPPNMQALVLALFLFTTAIGDGIAALLYGSVFAALSNGTAMVVCAVCMLINMFFFARVGRRWTPFGSNQEQQDGLELRPVQHTIEQQQ